MNKFTSAIDLFENTLPEIFLHMNFCSLSFNNAKHSIKSLKLKCKSFIKIFSSKERHKINSPSNRKDL